MIYSLAVKLIENKKVKDPKSEGNPTNEKDYKRHALGNGKRFIS